MSAHEVSQQTSDSRSSTTLNPELCVTLRIAVFTTERHPLKLRLSKNGVRFLARPVPMTKRDKPLDDKGLELELKGLRLALLDQELARYRLASRALLVIGAVTLAFSIYATWHREVTPSWQIIVLWGVATLCVGLPLIGKFSVSKDGGGVEVGSPFDVIDKYEAKAEAARTAALRKTEQVIGGLSQQ